MPVLVFKSQGVRLYKSWVFKFPTANNFTNTPPSFSRSGYSLSQNRWVDDVTIRVLESILVSKDVQSSIEFKSVLKRFMRDESLLIFGEIAEEAVEIKLTCAEFLIRVFAMIGDVESCLALRYEALVMREERATMLPDLQVTCKEWVTFAKHSLENGFHSIANQGQAKAYLKREKVEESTQQLAISTEAREGSSRFRSGIKKHNLRKLHEYRCLRSLSP